METTMTTNQTYAQKTITKIRASAGFDPRHIEGYMRLHYNTLSQLSMADFRREVRICVACIREGGVDTAERNARSFGL